MCVSDANAGSRMQLEESEAGGDAAVDLDSNQKDVNGEELA